MNTDGSGTARTPAARHVPRRLPARGHDLRRLRRRTREQPLRPGVRPTAAPRGPPRSCGPSTRSSRARRATRTYTARVPARRGRGHVVRQQRDALGLDARRRQDGPDGAGQPRRARRHRHGDLDGPDRRREHHQDRARPSRATIGQVVTWNVTVVIAANTTFYDASLDRPGPGRRRRHDDHRLPCAVLTVPSRPCTAVPVRLERRGRTRRLDDRRLELRRPRGRARTVASSPSRTSAPSPTCRTTSPA